MKMEDPWNPSAKEIEGWAFDAQSLEPEQDWDLALCWKREETLYLELASNEECPKRKYFVHILYLIVGDAVRAEYKNVPKPIIEGFVERGSQYSHPDIKTWAQRSKQLMKNPTLFNYEEWCAGKHAQIQFT
jgi:hypothetical protein